MTKKLFFLSFCILTMLSCGGGSKSKEQIQSEINELHSRINTLEQEIPRTQWYIDNDANPNNTDLEGQIKEMKNNLRDYKIQLDELNRQLVNAK